LPRISALAVEEMIPEQAVSTQQRKSTMKAKTKKKKEKSEIKVHDLKPVKDAKGGWNPQPDPPRGPSRAIPPPC
jgi:hypothetical protein